MDVVQRRVLEVRGWKWGKGNLSGCKSLDLELSSTNREIQMKAEVEDGRGPKKDAGRRGLEVGKGAFERL